MMHLTTLSKALIHRGKTEPESDRFEVVPDPKTPQGHPTQLQTEEKKSYISLKTA